MTMSIGGITSQAVELAMDGLSLRHQAIAANLANINSIGYRPVSISFEDKVAELIAGKNDSGLSLRAADSALRPKVSYGSPIGSTSSEMRLDMNTVLLNQNVVQYQALVKGLDKYISTIALATNDGRR